MPKLTRYYLKSAFLFLFLALLVALILALRSIIELPTVTQHLVPVFFHLFMVGWVTQMIFGIAFWMFPIISREEPRGSYGIGWATYALLNIGLLLRIVSEPLNNLYAGFAWDSLLLVSALLQWTAGLLFVLNSWPRIKSRYRH